MKHVDLLDGKESEFERRRFNADHGLADDAEGPNLKGRSTYADHAVGEMEDAGAIQSYDPRQDRQEPVCAPCLYDQHVRDHEEHMERIARPTREFREVMELAWCYRTGQLKTPSASKAVEACGEGGHCDRAKLAWDYLTSTFGWGDLLAPVVVGFGDGARDRKTWGNRLPTWPTAHRLWVRFAPNLLKRLERQPFAAFVENEERNMAYSGTSDDLRDEAARLAEIERKYPLLR